MLRVLLSGLDRDTFSTPEIEGNTRTVLNITYISCFLDPIAVEIEKVNEEKIVRKLISTEEKDGYRRDNMKEDKK